ncbi:hypothetical protein WJX72_005473 [[Myrmecia] bisecta]|uniref:Uncharacterized protein n=1 Tax=[Myrmecia] bisecta TaxID=41462 RepID=A0AAW1PPV6_9CHLO
MAQVKCLILATTSSSTFEEQLHQRGSDINGLSAHSTDRVTLPLLPVGGVTVLDKWLKADHLVVIDSSYCFEPDFNLRRIVQTAVVRGKDTICYTDTAQQAAAKQTLSKIRAIPPQFADVKVWKHKPRKQHPVYATSNNTYGYKQPTQQEMPMSWNGIRGEFTKNFVVGNGHTGFATGITGSKVHRALDDL